MISICGLAVVLALFAALAAGLVTVFGRQRLPRAADALGPPAGSIGKLRPGLMRGLSDATRRREHGQVEVTGPESSQPPPGTYAVVTVFEGEQKAALLVAFAPREPVRWDPLLSQTRLLDALPLGSASYAAYWGVDAENRPVALVVDFKVLPD